MQFRICFAEHIHSGWADTVAMREAKKHERPVLAQIHVVECAAICFDELKWFEITARWKYQAAIILLTVFCQSHFLFVTHVVDK